MGLRDALLRLLSRGEVVDDPDELIEVALVPVASGPMTVAWLCDRGFTATGYEAFDVVSRTASRFSVRVPRHQADAALAELSTLADG